VLRARFLAVLFLPLLATSAGAAPSSRPLGLPWAGALVDGVRLPAQGKHFFTWDPVLRR